MFSECSTPVSNAIAALKLAVTVARLALLFLPPASLEIKRPDSRPGYYRIVVAKLESNLTHLPGASNFFNQNRVFVATAIEKGTEHEEKQE